MPDIPGAPRKRRRPPLSCIECRRRKIKCDRTRPCKPCVQSGTTVCSYTDSDAAISQAPQTPLSLDDGTTNSDVVHGLGREGHDAELLDGVANTSRAWAGSQSTDAPCASASGRKTNNISPRKRALNSSRPRTRKSPDLIVPEFTRPTDNDGSMSMMGIDFSTFEDIMIQDGDDRSVLRTKVFRNSSSNPIQDVKGTLSKTRFFQSHSMFALKQVNHYFRHRQDCKVNMFSSPRCVGCKTRMTRQ